MLNIMQLVQLLITIQNFLSKETDLKMSSFLMSPHAAPSVAMRKMVSTLPEILSIWIFVWVLVEIIFSWTYPHQGWSPQSWDVGLPGPSLKFQAFARSGFSTLILSSNSFLYCRHFWTFIFLFKSIRKSSHLLHLSCQHLTPPVHCFQWSFLEQAREELSSLRLTSSFWFRLELKSAFYCRSFTPS